MGLGASTILGDYRRSVPFVLPTGTIIQIVKERDPEVGEVGFRFPLGGVLYTPVDSLSSGFRSIRLGFACGPGPSGCTTC